MSVYIIAEIGINHNGNMRLAKRLIEKAKEYGANAVKFQLYDPRKIFKNQPKKIKEALKCELLHKQWLMLVSYAHKIGIPISASVFDRERFQWLKDINPPWYKIASRTFEDSKFIKTVLKEGKLTYISLGKFTYEKFNDHKKLALLADYKAQNAKFFQCVSEYPAQLQSKHFYVWRSLLKNRGNHYFDNNTIIGYSDHTVGLEALLWAIAHGAMVIEKHFTLDKNMKGPDHICSMIPDELRVLRNLSLKLEDLASKALRGGRS